MTRSHHCRPKSTCCLRFTSLATMVFPLKRVPPKSFVRSRSEKPKLSRTETRKDSAVHVSLSSSSLVKQPGTRGPTLPLLEGSVTTSIGRQITTDCYRLFESLTVMRSYGREQTPWPQSQCIAALSGRVIGPPYRTCQQLSSTNCRIMWKKSSAPRSPAI